MYSTNKTLDECLDPLDKMLFGSYKHKEMQELGWRGSLNPMGGLEAQTLEGAKLN
jgi:hypothetical protein